MRAVRGFARFWYDFIVGDDWTIAAWVVAIVGVTYVFASRWNVWLFLPVAVFGALAMSLRRAARDARAPVDDGT